MSNGILIGLSLLLGVALGWKAVLIVVPAAILLEFLRGAMGWRLALVGIACVGISAVRGATVIDGPTGVEIGGSRGAEGVVVSLPIAGGQFERTTLLLDSVELEDGSWHDAESVALIYVPDQHDGLSLGDRILVTWDATDVSLLAPGYGSYVRSEGAEVSAWVLSYEIVSEGPTGMSLLSDARRLISGALQGALADDAGALAAGMVTGDDSGLSEDTVRAFRLTGTSHVTAVSGQNVSLLLGFLSLWMRLPGGRRRLVIHALMISAVWMYAGMVGLEAPAMRAAIVASLSILGVHVGRRPDPLTLLALTLGAMAVIDPGMSRSIGFWLSASASLALCMVVQTTAPEGIRRQAFNLMMGPVAASLGTLPIIIWTFGTWSPVTPLANAVLSPVMTVTFGATYVLSALVFIAPPLVDALAWIPGIGLDTSLSIVHRMETVAMQIHLDTSHGAIIPMIALPCAVILFAMGRESERWLQRANRAFSS